MSHHRYVALYEKLIGEKFIPAILSDDETFNVIEKEVKELIYSASARP